MVGPNILILLFYLNSIIKKWDLLSQSKFRFNFNGEFNVEVMLRKQNNIQEDYWFVKPIHKIIKLPDKRQPTIYSGAFWSTPIYGLGIKECSWKKNSIVSLGNLAIASLVQFQLGLLQDDI